MISFVYFLAFVASPPTLPTNDLASVMVNYGQCMDQAGAALEPSRESSELVAKAAALRCVRELEAVVQVQKVDFMLSEPTKSLVAQHGESAIGPWIVNTKKKIERWGIERAQAAVIEARAKRYGSAK